MVLVEFSCSFFQLIADSLCDVTLFQAKDTGLLYLSLGFTFLTASMLQIVESSYGLKAPNKHDFSKGFWNYGGLAFFTAFIICTIVALKKMTGSYSS
jgi:hypothetical protein